MKVHDVAAPVCSLCGSSEARYVTAGGHLSCALCPLGQRLDSVRLADVPALLAWCREWLDLNRQAPGRQRLLDVLGRDVSA